MKAKQTEQKEIGRYSGIENTLEGYLKADQAAEAEYQVVLWRGLLALLSIDYLKEQSLQL